MALYNYRTFYYHWTLNNYRSVMVMAWRNWSCMMVMMWCMMMTCLYHVMTIVMTVIMTYLYPIMSSVMMTI